MGVCEFQSINSAHCFAGREVSELIDGVALHTNMARHRVYPRAVTSRAFARFVFLDPPGFPFWAKLVFQHRFAVSADACLHILVPESADTAPFFAAALTRGA